MKGHFSIEWLSQSSQKTGPEPRDTALPGPCTSSTAPESLPGFYSSWGVPHPGPRRLPGIAPHSAQGSPSVSLQPELNPAGRPDLSHRTSAHALEAGFSSGAEEEETSGYESEGGRSASSAAQQGDTGGPPSPSPSSASSSSSPSPPGRRPRTAFTAEQISRLERTFKKHAYLGTREKEELCRKLNLSEKQIKNWFQNRRMKLKRTLQDALAQACHAKVASQLLHYPELQAFGPTAPYSGYYPGQDCPATYPAPPGLPYAPSPLAMETPLYPYSVAPMFLPPGGTGATILPRYHPYSPRY
ncbi:ventrally expressed dharma/bozozok antagonist [Amia ocellicauda]|uniref:ventrally expressed dharma/bozozok antagonist n=1 Tax=Amia ocellicauda TaxID=2972642 RepID=UPI0034642FA7